MPKASRGVASYHCTWAVVVRPLWEAFLFLEIATVFEKEKGETSFSFKRFSYGNFLFSRTF